MFAEFTTENRDGSGYSCHVNPAHVAAVIECGEERGGTHILFLGTDGRGKLWVRESHQDVLLKLKEAR